MKASALLATALAARACLATAPHRHSAIQHAAATVVPDAAVTISVSPNLITSGACVTVAFSAPSPAAGDWVAAMSPPGADPATQAPVEWKLGKAAPQYLSTGAGNLTFCLVNMRADYAFAFFRGGLAKPTLAASSANVTFADAGAPTHPRLALTADGAGMTLTWQSASRDGHPTATLTGPTGGGPAAAVSSTYTAASIHHRPQRGADVAPPRRPRPDDYLRWRERAAAPRREAGRRCTAGSCVPLGVRVSLAEGEGLVFCRDCSDPHVQGALVDTWEAAFHPPGFHVHGELVLAVPNDARTPLDNAVGGAVVLVDRGNVSFAVKARHCQDAGALAVVIADDGSCGDDFACGGRLGSRGDGGRGAAEADGWREWADVDVPVVLITARSARRIAAHLELGVVTVDGQVHRFAVGGDAGGGGDGGEP